MRPSAKRNALLHELSALVKAVHGPKAMVVPYNLGVQLLGTGVHDCTTWDQLDEMDEWIGRAGEAERLAEERLAHANQLQADIEAEMQGRLALRKRLGAREDETMGAFLERLATMAGVVPANVHEHGWQWRPTDADTAFAPPFGTIRQCRVCGCLVAGGPTACARCAEAGA